MTGLASTNEQHPRSYDPERGDSATSIVLCIYASRANRCRWRWGFDPTAARMRELYGTLVPLLESFVDNEPIGPFSCDVLATTSARGPRMTADLAVRLHESLASVLSSATRPRLADLGMAIGMAMGKRRPRVQVGSCPIAQRAHALAMIAQPRQTLIDASLRQALEPISQGLILDPATPRERAIVGFDGIVEVSQIVPPNESPKEILNLPVLRPQLKLLEDITSNLLAQQAELREVTSLFEGSPSPANFQNLKAKVDAHERFVGQLRERMNGCLELQGVPELVAHVHNLSEASQGARNACTVFAEAIDEDAQKQAVSQIVDTIRQFEKHVRDTHIVADKLIREGDDALGLDGYMRPIT